jgi:hypothetical protein
VKSTLYYNFRLGPEAMWLVVNTVIGTVIVEVLAGLIGVNKPGDIADPSSFLWGLLFGGVRTALGAILAMATGGGFQNPGEPAENEPPAG